MNCYQLSCGHWVSQAYALRIGDLCGCVKCDTYRTTVTGFSARAEFGLAAVTP